MSSRRGLDDDLVLVVVLQAERVVAVATVGRPAARLHVGGRPGLGTDGAQEGRRVKGAGAHLHVVGLQDDAAALGPVVLQAQYQVLESSGRVAGFVGLIGAGRRRKRAKYNGRRVRRRRPSGGRCGIPSQHAARRARCKSAATCTTMVRVAGRVAPEWCVPCPSGTAGNWSIKQQCLATSTVWQFLQPLSPRAGSPAAAGI